MTQHLGYLSFVASGPSLLGRLFLLLLLSSSCLLASSSISFTFLPLYFFSFCVSSDTPLYLFPFFPSCFSLYFSFPSSPPPILTSTFFLFSPATSSCLLPQPGQGAPSVPTRKMTHRAVPALGKNRGSTHIPPAAHNTLDSRG